MNLEAVFGKARLLRALTSLDRAEFARLEEAMDKFLVGQRAERRHDGLPRQRAFGAGGPGKLPTTKVRRLLFSLFSFQGHPWQQVLAFLFGMSQPQAGEWLKKLPPQVNAVPGRELFLPARRPADRETLLAEVPELRLLVLDGAERPVRRPKDKGDQKKNYRGKKKAHRQKHLLLSRRKAGRLPGANQRRQRARQEAGRREWIDRPARRAGGSKTPASRATRRRTPRPSSPRKSQDDARTASAPEDHQPTYQQGAGSPSNTPAAASNAATSSRTPGATGATGATALWTRSCSPPAACTTCASSPAPPETTPQNTPTRLKHYGL